MMTMTTEQWNELKTAAGLAGEYLRAIPHSAYAHSLSARLDKAVEVITAQRVAQGVAYAPFIALPQGALGGAPARWDEGKTYPARPGESDAPAEEKPWGPEVYGGTPAGWCGKIDPSGGPLSYCTKDKGHAGPCADEIPF